MNKGFIRRARRQELAEEFIARAQRLGTETEITDSLLRKHKIQRIDLIAALTRPNGVYQLAVRIDALKHGWHAKCH